jgi:hypothetical protein
LQPVQAEIDVLTNQVYALCKRMTVLENYRLVSQSRSDLETDLQQIKAKINGTEDSLTQREYEESRQSLQERALQAARGFDAVGPRRGAAYEPVERDGWHRHRGHPSAGDGAQGSRVLCAHAHAKVA